LETLGDHLRKKRLGLKLLQRDIAQKLGVDKTSVHNWERNLTKPSITLIPKILNFLKYNPFETPTGSLGEKIKAYRRIIGLSQKALAKRLKIDPTTLARWEKGKGRPSKELLQTLLNFFTSLPSFSSKHEG
jgi:transcriptional regulator with XRE-family HTH domain